MNKKLKLFLFFLLTFCFLTVPLQTATAKPANHITVIDFDGQPKNSKSGSNSLCAWETISGTDGLIRGQVGGDLYYLAGNEGTHDGYALSNDKETTWFNTTSTYTGFYIKWLNNKNSGGYNDIEVHFYNANLTEVIRLRWRVDDNEQYMSHHDGGGYQNDLTDAYVASTKHTVYSWSYEESNEIRYKVYAIDNETDTSWDTRCSIADIGYDSSLATEEDYEVKYIKITVDGDISGTISKGVIYEIGYVDIDITGDDAVGVLDSVSIYMNEQAGIFNQTIDRPCLVSAYGYGTGNVRFMLYIIDPDDKVIREVDSVDDSLLTFFIPRTVGEWTIRVVDYYTDNDFDESYTFDVLQIIAYDWYETEYGSFFVEFYHQNELCYYNEGDEFIEVIYNFSDTSGKESVVNGYLVELQIATAQTWEGGITAWATVDAFNLKNSSIAKVERIYITGERDYYFKFTSLIAGHYRMRVSGYEKDANGNITFGRPVYVSTSIDVCDEGQGGDQTAVPDSTIVNAIDNTFSDEQQFLLGMAILAFFVMLPIFLSYKLSGSHFKTTNLARQLTSIPPFLYIMMGSIGLGICIYLELFELWSIVLLVFIIVGSIAWQLLGNSTYFTRGDNK